MLLICKRGANSQEVYKLHFPRLSVSCNIMLKIGFEVKYLNFPYTLQTIRTKSILPRLFGSIGHFEKSHNTLLCASSALTGRIYSSLLC